jgi:hypothetical protein
MKGQNFESKGIIETGVQSCLFLNKQLIFFGLLHIKSFKLDILFYKSFPIEITIKIKRVYHRKKDLGTL